MSLCKAFLSTYRCAAINAKTAMSVKRSRKETQTLVFIDWYQQNWYPTENLTS